MLYKIECRIKKLYIILKKIMSSNITGSNKNVAKFKSQKFMGHSVDRSLMLLIGGAALASSLLTLLLCTLLRNNLEFKLPICVMFETAAKLKLASLNKIEQLSEDGIINLAKFCLLSKRIQTIEGNSELIKKLSETIKEELDDIKDKKEAFKIIESCKESLCPLFTIKNPYCSIESVNVIKKVRDEYKESLRCCLYNPTVTDIISCANKTLDKIMS